MFECPHSCKQVYPFKELKTHRQKGLCYLGYVRQEEEPPTNVSFTGYQMSGTVGQQSQILPSAPFAQVESNNQSMMIADNNYNETRPPCSMVHVLQKDSKVIFKIDFNL